MASTDPVKNKRGRNKFLTCFNPVANDEEPTGCFSASSSCSDSESGRRRKATKLHRSLSGAMKAVFCKTSLVKKTRSKKSRQDLHRSNSDSSLTNENLEKNFAKRKNSSHRGFSDHESVVRTNSNTTHSSLFSSNSSSSASSSRASSFSSHSRSSSERVKRLSSLDLRENVMKRNQSMKKGAGIFASCSYSTGMCMFVVCLVALLLGKAFAILTCTSAWLFFAPARRSNTVDSPEDAVDWAEYKKKVIMDGLLERNRSRVFQS